MAKTEWKRCMHAHTRARAHTQTGQVLQRPLFTMKVVRAGTDLACGGIEEHTNHSPSDQIKSKPEMCISVDSCILVFALILRSHFTPLLTHSDWKLNDTGS